MNTSYHYHVYSLPVELLDTLSPRNLVNQIQTPRSPSPTPTPAPSISGATACNICRRVAFPDVDEQRTHFRSDWHRYNVKIRLDGKQPVTESEFAQLVDGLEDSISGSATSSDENDSAESDAVATLVNKTKRVARSPSPTAASRFIPQTALAWFHSPPATQIGVYKALLSNRNPTSSYVSELKDMQSRIREGRKWAMFMVAGGHFAGAIVRVSRPDDDEENGGGTRSKKVKPKRPKPDTEVLKHKTFHRYTTRRKQGGSQSVNDNAKGNAKSAGAQLRRYGEQALRDDIRNLLQDWAEEINDCERIWIRASSSNRKIFVDYDGGVISKGDERLRTFPFPTRRPTQSELSRCILELTRVKVSHLTEDALRAQDEAYLASLPKPKPVPTIVAAEPEKPRLPKLTKEEETHREKWSRLLEMVNKGRLEPLKSFWQREGSSIGSIDVAIPDWAGERWGSLLQVATKAGHEDIVQWLLVDQHADPTIEVPFTKLGENEEKGNSDYSDASDSPPSRLTGAVRRTAYDLARSRGVRDVFRRCAAAEPNKWDWFGAGHVSSALSKEMEEEREEKKKVRRKGLKERVKEREAKAREKEKDRPPSVAESVATVDREPQRQDPSGPRKLGGTAGAMEGIVGLTPEMRIRVERERRARAAEARLKRLGTS